MKRTLVFIALAALLAGCASHNDSQGGTYDQSGAGTGNMNSSATSSNAPDSSGTSGSQNNPQ